MLFLAFETELLSKDALNHEGQGAFQWCLPFVSVMFSQEPSSLVHIPSPHLEVKDSWVSPISRR